MTGYYNPYAGPQAQFAMDQMQQFQQRVQTPPMSGYQQLIKVTGIEGAKAYQMPPNSAVPLFDADNDIMYVKTTDGAGFPTIRAFSFQPIEGPQHDSGEFITRDEFDKAISNLKGMIDNGKFAVWNSNAPNGSAQQVKAEPVD